jgi:hypothetical protein
MLMQIATNSRKIQMVLSKKKTLEQLQLQSALFQHSKIIFTEIVTESCNPQPRVWHSSARTFHQSHFAICNIGAHHHHQTPPG